MKYILRQGKCAKNIGTVGGLLNCNETNVGPTERDQPLLLSKKRLRFQKRMDLERIIYGHQTRCDPKTSMTVLARPRAIYYYPVLSGVGGIRRHTDSNVISFTI
jgi:hypothetical protein